MPDAARLERSPDPALLRPDDTEVPRRLVPYPYRAMLAICSDLDETPDQAVYRETARFLNTLDETPMGPGVGLETGNSIYFDMPPGQFSYWGTDDRGRALVRALIRSGHVDCLHSYGDLAATRAHAGRALDDLVRHDCQLAVWVDHATAPTNFGDDIMRGRGDVPASPAYHADLTLAYGIRYVWRGRVTSVLGQEVPRRVAALFDPGHAAGSLVTLAKEAAKGGAARAGSRKYAMHAANRVLRPARLRDGQATSEFLRSNPHWGGVSCGETASGLAGVLTPRMLDDLAGHGGLCILYTHLGKVQDPREPLPAPTRDALRRLAARAASGEILVTTTRRLLAYCDARQRVRATLVRGLDSDRLELAAGDLDADDLQGLTFHVPHPERTQIYRGSDRAPVAVNRADRLGPASVSIPWKRLEFPAL